MSNHRATGGQPHPYGSAYRRKRSALVGQPCIWCGQPATTADHVPPLASAPPGQWVGTLHPACQKCNLGNKAKLAMKPRGRRDNPRPRRRKVLA